MKKSCVAVIMVMCLLITGCKLMDSKEEKKNTSTSTSAAVTITNNVTPTASPNSSISSGYIQTSTKDSQIHVFEKRTGQFYSNTYPAKEDDMIGKTPDEVQRIFGQEPTYTITAAISTESLANTVLSQRVLWIYILDGDTSAIRVLFEKGSSGTKVIAYWIDERNGYGYSSVVDLMHGAPSVPEDGIYLTLIDNNTEYSYSDFESKIKTEYFGGNATGVSSKANGKTSAEMKLLFDRANPSYELSYEQIENGSTVSSKLSSRKLWVYKLSGDSDTAAYILYDDDKVITFYIDKLRDNIDSLSLLTNVRGN